MASSSARRRSTAPASRRKAPPAWGPQELHDYALIADGRRGALIGPNGEFAWMCFPGWDSGAVFSDLVGGLGRYEVTPQGRFVWGGYYEHGTLIWRSRWVTNDGIVECREALARPSAADRAVVLRRIVGVEGSGRMDILLQPRADYGRAPWKSLHRQGNSWIGRTGDIWVRWTVADSGRDLPDGARGRLLALEADFARGSQQDLVLELSVHEFNEPVPDPEQLWQSTAEEWRRELPPAAGVVAHRDVQHSCCVLSGLTTPGGGTVAAATTSLPERAEESRSYDYRYVWIRDQSYIGQAMAAYGSDPLLDESIRFVSDRLLEHGPRTAPAYTTTGEPLPDPHRLGLPGYPGGTDIVGNHVNHQFQLDAFGEALLLLSAGARRDRLGEDHWKAVEVAVEAIATRWREPDAGLWELEPRRWTHSRLAAVAGLRAVIAAGAPRSAVGPWSSLAEAILAEVSATSVHPSGRWMRAPDLPGLDSALLLPAIRGAVPPGDARSRLTLEAVLDELTRDGYAYRYQPDPRPLGQAEGSFLLCGFIVSMALSHLNRPVKAARWFERSRSTTGPAGLLAEEFDVDERQLRGNLPQAFVHAALIEAACLQSETAGGNGV